MQVNYEWLKPKTVDLYTKKLLHQNKVSEQRTAMKWVLKTMDSYALLYRSTVRIPFRNTCALGLGIFPSIVTLNHRFPGQVASSVY